MDMGRVSLWMLVLAFQFFAFFAEESLAIQCYKCEGDGMSTYCNDPFDPNRSGVSKCKGGSCSKAKTTYAGLQIIIRNCTDEVVDGSFCADTSAMGMTAKGCICNTDLCNNSRRFASFTELFMFLSIASLAFLLKYF